MHCVMYARNAMQIYTVGLGSVALQFLLFLSVQLRVQTVVFCDTYIVRRRSIVCADAQIVPLCKLSFLQCVFGAHG